MPDDLDILLRQLKDLKAQKDSGALAEEPYREQVAKVLAGEQLPEPATPSRTGPKSFLVTAPLGNAANSVAPKAPARPQSPLERALAEARKADLPSEQHPFPSEQRLSPEEPSSAVPAQTLQPQTDPQVLEAPRRDSYWDRSSRILRPLPALADDLGGAASPVAGYWSRAQRADRSA